MKKIKLTIAAIVIFLFAFVVGSSFTSYAEEGETEYPLAEDDVTACKKKYSELVTTGEGYMRVVCVTEEKTVYIEYYDDNFNILSKQSISYELDYWGGFFAGSDAYYIVTGQENEEEIDTAEVIRVDKYDTNWNKLGTASITGDPELSGGRVRIPFDAGCVEMTELNGRLYIATGHEGYVDPAYAQGHQGLLVVEVDESTMTGKVVLCDSWHSFAQYIDNDGTDIYLFEQSDGSRCSMVSRFTPDVYDNIWGILEKTIVKAFNYGGEHTSSWAIACYATVDDFELSTNNAIGLGTSVDQTNYDNVTSSTPYNIYLTITPKNDFTDEATTVKWLTNYDTAGKYFYNTRLVSLGDDKFMVLWQETIDSQEITGDDLFSSGTLHYVIIDENGNLLSEEMTAAATLPNCEPIVKGSKVVICASCARSVAFYTIDISNGDFTKKIYNVAGKNAGWKIEDNTLVIYGTGDVTELSNIWKLAGDSFDKVLVEGGINSIPTGAFYGLSNLKEVEIQEGVTSIGEKAFYCCENLTDVTIPSSVTSIGADIIWTGSTWIGSGAHVYKATIHAVQGSYAVDYAIENGINYKITLSDTTKRGWQEIDGKHYYVCEDGALATGWYYVEENQKNYYFDGYGVRATGWAGECYFYEDGTTPKGWTVIDNQKYYFHDAGMKCVGWNWINAERYYLGEDGIAPTGWQVIDDETYYLEEDGKVSIGWKEIDSKWYYFNEYGDMAKDTWIDDCYVDENGVWAEDTDNDTDEGTDTDQETGVEGWQQSGDRWWYQCYDGSYLASQWKDIDGIWYYFDAWGWMETGWLNDGGTWYYLNGSGAMKTGWLNDGGTWYYLNGSGAMETGWLNDGGTWYYLDDSGVMQTGWFLNGGKWYHCNTSGAMETGWVNSDATWYYMDPSGAMRTGWFYDFGTWYYFDSSGAMETGWQNIGGTWYLFNASGAMESNAQTYPNAAPFSVKDVKMILNRLVK